MLVTFKTDAYASITMFGEVAVTLIKFMGHSGSVPGALLPEDIPAALERLKAKVAADPHAPLDPAGAKAPEGDADEPPVDLSRRAWPLIELLRAAAAANKHVTWDN